MYDHSDYQSLAVDKGDYIELPSYASGGDLDLFAFGGDMSHFHRTDHQGTITYKDGGNLQDNKTIDVYGDDYVKSLIDKTDKPTLDRYNFLINETKRLRDLNDPKYQQELNRRANQLAILKSSLLPGDVKSKELLNEPGYQPQRSDIIPMSIFAKGGNKTTRLPSSSLIGLNDVGVDMSKVYTPNLKLETLASNKQLKANQAADMYDVQPQDYSNSYYNYSGFDRYAPVMANIGLGISDIFSKPESVQYGRYTPEAITSRMDYTPFDTE